MTKTQRSYTDKETGVVYRLHTDQADRLRLIDRQGNECKAFYLSASVNTAIKLNTGEQISLSVGQFYTLKEGEQVTHRKFIGIGNFRKL